MEHRQQNISRVILMYKPYDIEPCHFLSMMFFCFCSLRRAVIGAVRQYVCVCLLCVCVCVCVYLMMSMCPFLAARCSGDVPLGSVESPGFGSSSAAHILLLSSSWTTWTHTNTNIENKHTHMRQFISEPKHERLMAMLCV